MGLNLLKTIMGQYFTIYHTLILLSFNKYYAADNKMKDISKGTTQNPDTIKSSCTIIFYGVWY